MTATLFIPWMFQVKSLKGFQDVVRRLSCDFGMNILFCFEAANRLWQEIEMMYAGLMAWMLASHVCRNMILCGPSNEEETRLLDVMSVGMLGVSWVSGHDIIPTMRFHCLT